MDAKEFAIKAHKGQVRKVEPDKPLVIHPIDVANILKEYGFSKYVVDAGYLHDVVEDTNYSLEDIKNNFGEKVYKLVKNATDEDKTLSWEVRKQAKIDKIKKLDLDSKALICADKISNLEDLRNLFGKIGKYDFSRLKRGFEKQKWYYESIYNSLIENTNNEPIFDRLKYLIDQVFYEQDKNKEKLHFKRNEIRKLNSVIDNIIDIDMSSIRNDEIKLDQTREKFINILHQKYN